MLTIDEGDRRAAWLNAWRQAVGDDLLDGYAELHYAPRPESTPTPNPRSPHR